MNANNDSIFQDNGNLGPDTPPLRIENKDYFTEMVKIER